MQILLLGDSIRLGYTPFVRECLGSSHTVHSPADNGRFTLYTLRYLHEWARECTGGVDMVHWNNGLWDAAHYPMDGEPITPLAEYARNLGRVLCQIRGLFPEARIVFALTTPVHDAHPVIRNAEIERMNAAATDLMAREEIPVNDLHAEVRANPGFLSNDLIHMTAEGYRALGKKVAAHCLA